MKKILMIFILFLSLSLVVVSAAESLQSCLVSSDDYAVEVVINKPGIEYNLNYLSNAQNVVFRGGQYSFLSQVSKNLITVISEVPGDVSGGEPGLSIRLQIPTISARENVHTLDIISKSIKGRIINENITPSYDGWGIDCNEERVVSECRFISSDMRMRAYLEEGKYNAELLINGVSSCDKGCDGYCVRSGGESSCIDNARKEKISDLLAHVGLARDFNEFIGAYSIVKNGIAPTTTLKAESNEEVNWRDALRSELSWLKSEDIIRLSNEDIESISSLAKQGAAGQNNRIVYAKNSQGAPTWIYYKDSIKPTLSFDKECSEFAVSPSITGGVVFESADSRIYYLLPISIIIIIVLIFALVVTFTRWNYERNKHRKLAIEKEIHEVGDRKSIREKSGI